MNKFQGQKNFNGMKPGMMGSDKMTYNKFGGNSMSNYYQYKGTKNNRFTPKSNEFNQSMDFTDGASRYNGKNYYQGSLIRRYKDYTPAPYQPE
ncbi:MAG: hypothetical protein R3C11_15835 [Planctomycetaceae bacterium]